MDPGRDDRQISVGTDQITQFQHRVSDLHVRVYCLFDTEMDHYSWLNPNQTGYYSRYLLVLGSRTL